jgi:hypothetical protein
MEQTSNRHLLVNHALQLPEEMSAIAFLYFFSPEYQDVLMLRALLVRVDSDREPLLKSLIRMKAKHREIELEQVYSQNPEMFEQNRLLERLYGINSNN